jgi:predicted amidohydrolase YtcJ
MMKPNLARALLASTALVATATLAQATNLILINGKIATLDAGSSIVEALAIDDGKVEAVGSSAEIQAMVGDGAHVIDLGGRTVIPGLID